VLEKTGATIPAGYCDVLVKHCLLLARKREFILAVGLSTTFDRN
jgi:hypothetical protein